MIRVVVTSAVIRPVSRASSRQLRNTAPVGSTPTRPFRVSTPVANAVADAADAPDVPWAVMIGPEGGYAREELDALGKLPFVTRVALGQRLLRADTAAIAALACWQAVAGTWR